MEQALGKYPVLRESVMALFTEPKVDHENRPQISYEKTDVKIKQTTADAIQQFSLGKVAGAIVDFGRGLFDW